MQQPNAPDDSAVPWWFVVSLRNRFYLQNFVETGTGYGDTADFAARLFERVYTIELDAHVFVDYRHPRRDNISRYQGDSAVVLPQLIDPHRELVDEKKLDGPTLWYLDGHWPGMGPRPARECPLLDELDAICSRPPKEDVIMIDNAGFFVEGAKLPHHADQWPRLAEVKHHAPADLLFHLIADVIIFAPGPILML